MFSSDMRQSVLFIVNPVSGRKGKKRRIIKLLQERGCKLQFTRFAGDAVEIARNAVEDVVVAVGGDGTVNEVARGLTGTDKILGIVPCGSGDGLARHLGISGGVRSLWPTGRNLDRMLDIIENGRVRRLDWGTVNGNPFFSVCGTGLDAIVSERFAKAGSRGLMTYIREAVRTWRGFRPLKYTIETDGRTMETEAVLITCGNSSQWGNGARITPLAKSDDGLLEVTVLKVFRTIEIPVLVWRLMTGSLHKSRRAVSLRGKEIRIYGSAPGPFHLDGDWMPAVRNLEIRIMPDRLRVLVPYR